MTEENSAKKSRSRPLRPRDGAAAGELGGEHAAELRVGLALEEGVAQDTGGVQDAVQGLVTPRQLADEALGGARP